MFPKLSYDHQISLLIQPDVMTFIEQEWPEKFSWQQRVTNQLVNVPNAEELVKSLSLPITLDLTIQDFCNIAGLLPLSVIQDAKLTLEEIIYCSNHVHSIVLRPLWRRKLKSAFTPQGRRPLGISCPSGIVTEDYYMFAGSSITHFLEKDTSITVLVQILSDFATVGRRYLKKSPSVSFHLHKLVKKLIGLECVEICNFNSILSACKKVFRKYKKGADKVNIPPLLVEVFERVETMFDNEGDQEYCEEDYLEFDPEYPIEEYTYENLYVFGLLQNYPVSRTLSKEQLYDMFLLCPE